MPDTEEIDTVINKHLALPLPYAIRLYANLYAKRQSIKYGFRQNTT